MPGAIMLRRDRPRHVPVPRSFLPGIQSLWNNITARIQGKRSLDHRQNAPVVGEVAD
jgi:hypothetical protein